MSLFLFYGKYAPGTLGQISPERTKKAADIVRQAGGSIVAGYVTLGEHDIVAVVELPSNEAALKASIALARALDISFTTSPAVTVEAFDKLVG